MQLIDPNDIHSAADTWNGFIYQGKIALYHVLKLIFEDDNIDELFLQLDSLEDFAIIKYDVNAAVIPVSLHQVKAVKSHYYLRYKEAFEKLENRKITFPCEKDAYFHLATNNEKSKAEIEQLHPSIVIYEYDGESFCRIENLQEKINLILVSCLNKFNLNHLNNNIYIETLANNLEYLITENIVNIHAQNHLPNGFSLNKAAYINTISLISFKEIINTDLNYTLVNKQYFNKIIKIDLNRYFQEYCLEIEDDIGNDIKEKLSNYLIYFNGLNEIEFEKFLQNIMPHRIVKFSTLQEYKDNSLFIDEFKGALVLILTEIRDSDKDVINKLGWICTDNKRYFPSTINVSNTTNSKKNISEKIINVALDTLIDTPFNSDYIVTEGCQVDSLEVEALNIFKIENDNYDKITNWRKITLIDLEQAKTKLNENNN
ncbi:ABC-three component system protein [Flavobacterium sp. ZB4R12]|uniref:ABC-three component system protein n=1 Tax=Flavobacterium sp. ZB4R12 TaxID=3398732 RepID=UPI003AAAFA2C